MASRGRIKTPQAPVALAPPGYLLLDLLGRGGMGEVWRARQLSLDREVAVKILSPELAGEPAFVRRFDIEVAALSALAHPNVVAIIDRGTFKGTFYFVMEYAKGKSLREKVAAGRLPPEAALQVTKQLLSALAYAHRQAIVHRDLKPENILFDDQGVAKVADFGLAAMLGRNQGEELTRSAVAMGTASYMAPEQRRDAHKVDRRADLFSVGVVLYEMLVGEVPVGSFAMPRDACLVCLELSTATFRGRPRARALPALCRRAGDATGTSGVGEGKLLGGWPDGGGLDTCARPPPRRLASTVAKLRAELP